MNVFLDETRTKSIEFGLPMLDQLRMSPTLVETLKAEKGSTETWGDFAVRAMVALAVMRRMVRDQYGDANALLVGLGVARPDVRPVPAPDPTVAGAPNERQANRPREGSTAIPDPEMRRLKGAPTRTPQ